MPTYKSTVADFALTSYWKCTKKNGKLTSPYPSTATATKIFAYSLPSGSVIKTAKIWAVLGSTSTGTSFIKVNGSSTKEKNGNFTLFPITLPSTSENFPVKFEFKANGSKVDEAQHSGTMTFKNVYLEIYYEGGAAVQMENTNKKKEEAFSVPPQSVCIYDQTDDNIYMFDGVTKIQHSLTMDIQEEPDSKKKNKYVNNARNNPDKLTIDVVMSDVYTNTGAIITQANDYNSQQTQAGNAASKMLGASFSTQSSWTRSEAAANTIHWLKEQRRLLSVITPQFVHVDMIIASVTISQDDNTPFGWEGQIAFQHAFEEEKKQTNSKKDSGDVTVSTAAMVAGFMGTASADSQIFAAAQKAFLRNP